MKRSVTCILAVVLLLLVAAAGPASAGKDDSPNVIRMTVRPAGEPVPALKYRLLPELLEQTPGNAALLYYRMLDRIDGKDDAEQLEEWLEMPPGELPRKEVKALLGRYRAVLDETRRAARRDHCDWAFPFREEGFALTLPPLTKLRHLGWLLALRARLQMAEGDTDQAVHTLQTGFAFARHQADGTLLVNGLVGVGIANRMLQQVQQLSQMPDAPNLYWALATIRPPAIDLQRGVQYEMDGIYLWSPALRNVRTGRGLTEEQWQDFLGLALGAGKDTHRKLQAVALSIKLYPHAKQYLASRGYSRRQIDEMPVRRALATYVVETSQRISHDVYKWFLLPYREAHPGIREGEKVIRRAAVDPAMPGFPLTMLLPALGRAYFLQVRLDRRIAALRCVEAVRMYAAAHDGKLPAKLLDVREPPIPLNPATGEPFAYQAAGNKFTLIAGAPPDMSPRETDRYEVTVIAK